VCIQTIFGANSSLYTGVGGVFCGRSEMILPLGIGNLQKEERYKTMIYMVRVIFDIAYRYANMDFIFGSSLKAYKLPLVLISYNIQ